MRECVNCSNEYDVSESSSIKPDVYCTKACEEEFEQENQNEDVDLEDDVNDTIEEE